MSREEREDAIDIIQSILDKYEEDECLVTEITIGDEDIKAFKMAIKAWEQEPCCNCIEFKRYAKQMGFKIETQPIPYLMHKEMDIPLLECQKAYDVAIEYLRSQGKLKG